MPSLLSPWGIAGIVACTPPEPVIFWGVVDPIMSVIAIAAPSPTLSDNNARNFERARGYLL